MRVVGISRAAKACPQKSARAGQRRAHHGDICQTSARTSASAISAARLGRLMGRARSGRSPARCRKFVAPGVDRWAETTGAGGRNAGRSDPSRLAHRAQPRLYRPAAGTSAVAASRASDLRFDRRDGRRPSRGPPCRSSRTSCRSSMSGSSSARASSSRRCWRSSRRCRAWSSSPWPRLSCATLCRSAATH